MLKELYNKTRPYFLPLLRSLRPEESMDCYNRRILLGLVVGVPAWWTYNVLIKPRMPLPSAPAWDGTRTYRAGEIVWWDGYLWELAAEFVSSPEFYPGHPVKGGEFLTWKKIEPGDRLDSPGTADPERNLVQGRRER